MRVLVLSSAYPSRTQPTYGVFVRERVRHVARRCETVVVAPVPWFPFNRWVRGAARAATPLAEVQDGVPVYHPRFLCPPLIGKCLDAALYATCLAPFLVWLRRRFPFDVIDAHFTYPDGVAAALLARAMGRPLLITLRGTHDVWHGGFALRRLQIGRALRTATGVVAVSDSLRQFAVDLGVDGARVRVIPNGIDAARFAPVDRATVRARLGLPSRAVILLAVGALVEGKGHHRVIELLPRMLARQPDLLYVVVGGEPRESGYAGYLHALARTLGVADHLRIVGARPHDEIALWMGAADLFSLATRSEGWCNAITEALACGLPVVATRVGGNAEIVSPLDGLLVGFWDGPAFADAVLHALEFHWDRQGIAARARTRGWEDVAQAVVEELARVTRRAETPRVVAA